MSTRRVAEAAKHRGSMGLQLQTGSARMRVRSHCNMSPSSALRATSERHGRDMAPGLAQYVSVNVAEPHSAMSGLSKPIQYVSPDTVLISMLAAPKPCDFAQAIGMPQTPSP